MISSHELHKSLMELLDEIERQNEKMCPAEQENILNALAELWAAVESLSTQLKSLAAKQISLPVPNHKLYLVK
jgi:hypothetical protein